MTTAANPAGSSEPPNHLDIVEVLRIAYAELETALHKNSWIFQERYRKRLEDVFQAFGATPPVEIKIGDIRDIARQHTIAFDLAQQLPDGMDISEKAEDIRDAYAVAIDNLRWVLCFLTLDPMPSGHKGSHPTSFITLLSKIRNNGREHLLIRKPGRTR